LQFPLNVQIIVSNEQHSGSLEVAVVAAPNLKTGRYLAPLENTYIALFSEGNSAQTTEASYCCQLIALFRSSGSSLCSNTKESCRILTGIITPDILPNSEITFMFHPSTLLLHTMKRPKESF